uniref:Glycosyltransferase 2-like domain-containing protein n=1 Tax=Eubacterium plexicaudatum ASF492 TaxID=1235802 RepID=N2AEZ2_9FIRM
MIGIVILNYNNWKDTRRCVESIQKNPPQDAYQIILVDNASENRPEYDLYTWIRRNRICFIANKRNMGYNAGNNVGIRKALESGCSAILISNSDVRYFTGSIQYMRDYLKRHPHVGIVGPKIVDRYGRMQKSCICRRTGLREKYLVCTKANLLFQKSYRSYYGFDRDYDQTFPVYAVLGCCFMMSKTCAEAVAPFDEHPFLYEEELMLGTRMEQAGFATVYYPCAIVRHLHGGSTKYRKAAAFTQNVCSEIYYCRSYLGAAKPQIFPLYGYRMVLYLLRCAGSREFRRYWRSFLKMTGAEMNGVKIKGVSEYPLVSIIIRTCGRPQVLKRALESIRRQTYPNIEAVIVEDGKNAAEEMLKKEYADMRFIYQATGTHAGRSKTGNLAMQLSSGVYLNFLDDDDELFPDHVQKLVHALHGRQERAAYSIAQERQTAVRPGNRPYIKKKYIRYRQPFYRLLLYAGNYIPIQSILFERSLFETYGGLDEEIGMMEDWDLWVRYSAVTDFVYVNQVTSCYYVPGKSADKKEREKNLRRDMQKLNKKFCSYQMNISVGQLRREMEYVIREYKNQGLLRYIRMFFRMFVLGER